VADGGAARGTGPSALTWLPERAEHQAMLVQRHVPAVAQQERLADPVYALVVLLAGACFGIVATLLVFAIALGRL